MKSTVRRAPCAALPLSLLPLLTALAGALFAASPSAARILDLPAVREEVASGTVAVELSFEGSTAVLLRRGPGTFEVTLAYAPPPGEAPAAVSAAGDWNGWKEGATPLLRDGQSGRYLATLPLARGRYAYKLVVDGAWREDPSAAARRADPFGGFNSILCAGEPAEPPRLLPLPEEARADGGVTLRFRALHDAPLAGGALARDGAAPVAATVEAGALRFDLPEPPAGWLGVQAWDGAGALAVPHVRFAGDTAENPLARVLYFAFIDRFVNGRADNDEPVPEPRLDPAANFRGGDLDGLAWALDDGYFDRLGVTAIWISPPFPNARKAYKDALPPHRLFSGYHGYWPLTLDGVDPRFGTAATLKRIVDRGRTRGIDILLDAVFKHVHAESPLLAAQPDWFGKAELPDGRRNIRLYDEHPLTTWFDEFLPAFDFGHPGARAHLAAAGVALLERYGCAGFRLDAVKHIPVDFFGELRTALRAAGREPLLLGETIADRATIARYIGPDLLDGQFDFPLYHAIVPALASETTGMDALLAECDESARGYPPGAVMSTLLGNHDFPRFLAFADEDLPANDEGRERAFERPPVKVDRESSHDKLRLAFALLFSLRGVPLLYYGDEVGMTGAGDPDNRRMFEGPKPRTKQAARTFERVARLAEMRRGNPALVDGIFAPLSAARERMAFLRLDPRQRVLALFSRGEAGPFPVELPAALRGASRAVDLETGEAFAVKGGRFAPPVGKRAARLFELKE